MNNKGFTLVELIVVLVILAVLAAILVPALLEYIDEAKNKQDMLDAKNVMTAAQGKLIQLYSKGNYTDLAGALKGQNYTYKGDQGSGKDIDIDDQAFAKEIFKLADCNPYAFVFGVQKYGTANMESKNPHDSFTIYFALYCATKDSKPIYFDGKEWIVDYPWNETNPETGKKFADGENKCYYNGELIDMQLYIISAPGDKGYNFWQNLRDKKVY